MRWVLPEEAPAAAVLQCCAAVCKHVSQMWSTNRQAKMTEERLAQSGTRTGTSSTGKTGQWLPRPPGSRTSTHAGVRVEPQGGSRLVTHGLGARKGFLERGQRQQLMLFSACFTFKIRSTGSRRERAHGIVTLRDPRTHNTAPTGWVAVRSIRAAEARGSSCEGLFAGL